VLETGVPERTAKVIVLFSACLVLFSIINALSNFGTNEMLVCAVMGAIGAEGVLFSVWCVLAPTSWVVRLLSGLASAFVLFCAWCIGFAASVSDQPWRDWPSDAITALLWLPLLLLAVQIPLWAAKFWFRWRITDQEGGVQTEVSQSFGIRHIMAGTGTIALCLTMAKYGSDQIEGDAFVGLAIATLFVMLISTLTTVPATVAALRSRRLFVSLPVFLTINTAILAAYIVIISAVILKEWPPLADVVPQGGAMVLSHTACLAGPLLIGRWLGYRLRWGRE
jgi:hypothetical protein